MHTELNLEQRRSMWHNYDWLAGLFGAENVDREVMALKPSDICEEYASPVRGPDGRALTIRPPYHKFSIPIEDGRGYRFVRDGGWEKSDYSVPTKRWLVPSKYQNLGEGKVIKNLLIQHSPWLAGFKLAVYGGSYTPEKHCEFYVSVCENPNGQLYVPLVAFLNHDVEAIKERVTSYWRSYYVGARAPEAEATIKAQLDSPLTAHFFKLMTEEVIA